MDLRHILRCRTIVFTNAGLLCQWSKLQPIGPLTNFTAPRKEASGTKCRGPHGNLPASPKTVSNRTSKAKSKGDKEAFSAKSKALNSQLQFASRTTGHSLVKIDFPAFIWPSDITITCTECTRFSRRGLVEVDFMVAIANCCAKKQWWKVAPESHTSEVDKVVKVWATSKSEVEQSEALLPAPQKRKMPPLTHNVWIRSLLQDGDVEPNPGPLKPVSLNGAGVTNAIATVSYYAAERYDIIALQELNMFSAKQDKYSCFLACSSGYRLIKVVVLFVQTMALLVRACHRTTLIHKRVRFVVSCGGRSRQYPCRYCLSFSIFCQYAFHYLGIP